jgi:hypothetical protein
MSEEKRKNVKFAKRIFLFWLKSINVNAAKGQFASLALILRLPFTD